MRVHFEPGKGFGHPTFEKRLRFYKEKQDTIATEMNGGLAVDDDDGGGGGGDRG